MNSHCDQQIDRRRSDSIKWREYDADVLPLWVADMDFRSPEPVVQALRERVEHGVFGYGGEPPELRELLVERLQRLYGWQVAPEAFVFVPGVVPGFNLACRAVTAPGDGVLIQTPVYPPILHAAEWAGLVCDPMELTAPDGVGRYTVDFERFERTISPRTRVFLLCNPHNPVGRVFERPELERMAEICLRHDVLICSDEIHCDLVLGTNRHVPIASLSPEVARRSITLFAPSKTYNVAGLDCAVAVIPDEALRKQFNRTRGGLVGHPNVLGFVAALAAYREGQPWLDEVLGYLQANRDFLLQYVRTHLPGITMVEPEGTYLAWLDCRGAGLAGVPHAFFLQQARVALNDGATFGRGGAGFVRLNFGCPRATLAEALERMRKALIGDSAAATPSP